MLEKCIKGIAGGGKSSIVKELLDEGNKILMVTPSHRLRQDIEKRFGCDNLVVRTYASVFFHRVAKTNKYVSREVINCDVEFDVLLLDEFFSLKNNETEAIIRLTEALRVIAIGDPYQSTFGLFDEELVRKFKNGVDIDNSLRGTNENRALIKYMYNKAKDHIIVNTNKVLEEISSIYGIKIFNSIDVLSREINLYKANFLFTLHKHSDVALKYASSNQMDSYTRKFLERAGFNNNEVISSNFFTHITSTGVEFEIGQKVVIILEDGGRNRASDLYTILSRNKSVEDIYILLVEGKKKTIENNMFLTAPKVAKYILDYKVKFDFLPKCIYEDLKIVHMCNFETLYDVTGTLISVLPSVLEQDMLQNYAKQYIMDIADVLSSWIIGDYEKDFFFEDFIKEDEESIEYEGEDIVDKKEREKDFAKGVFKSFIEKNMSVISSKIDPLGLFNVKGISKNYMDYGLPHAILPKERRVDCKTTIDLRSSYTQTLLNERFRMGCGDLILPSSDDIEYNENYIYYYIVNKNEYDSIFLSVTEKMIEGSLLSKYIRENSIYLGKREVLKKDVDINKFYNLVSNGKKSKIWGFLSVMPNLEEQVNPFFLMYLDMLSNQCMIMDRLAVQFGKTGHIEVYGVHIDNVSIDYNADVEFLKKIVNEEKIYVKVERMKDGMKTFVYDSVGEIKMSKKGKPLKINNTLAVNDGVDKSIIEGILERLSKSVKSAYMLEISEYFNRDLVGVKKNRVVLACEKYLNKEGGINET